MLRNGVKKVLLQLAGEKLEICSILLKMVLLTEGVLTQIIITAGGILSLILSSLIGYIIWNKKDKKRREEKAEEHQEELRREAQEREERQNKDSREQTERVLSRLNEMDSKIDTLYEHQSTNAEAISLIFESDMIQFEAFRKSGLLNGDSERQEQKLNAFLQKRLKYTMTPEREK